MNDTPCAEAPRRRSRRKEARPAEIITAALALFAERGYGATRLDDVALHAGIGKGTIYLYFPTKEALFRAVVRQNVVPALQAAEAMVAAHEGPVADLLRGLVAHMGGMLASDLTAIPKLVLTESGNFPELAAFYAEEVVMRGRALIEGVLARGAASGEFRKLPPDTALPLFVAPLLFLALFKHSLAPFLPFALDPKAVLDTHVELLLRGLAQPNDQS